MAPVSDGIAVTGRHIDVIKGTLTFPDFLGAGEDLVLEVDAGPTTAPGGTVVDPATGEHVRLPEVEGVYPGFFTYDLGDGDGPKRFPWVVPCRDLARFRAVRDQEGAE